MMFTVCNVPKFLEEQMNKMKDTITSDMNEDNLKGYEYAIEVTHSAWCLWAFLLPLLMS